MNKLKIILFILIAALSTAVIIILDNSKNTYYGAKQVYRVYLDGKSLGLVESKRELENYIDKESQRVKDKYNVSKVYAPIGIEINEETTYNDKIESIENIYEKIRDQDNFTIEGYVIRIVIKESGEVKDDEKNEETAKETRLYVLDLDVFDEALKEVVYSFVGKNKYEDWLNKNQIEITATGTIIENVYYDAKIYTKKDLIPTNESIYTDAKELTRFLMFGDNEKEKIHIVKSGDTVKSIASKNNLNTGELLIANRDISDENALLYNGQKIIVNLINPVIPIVEQEHVVEYQPIKFKTEVIEDKNLMIGYSTVIQAGADGKSLVTNKVKKENGIKVEVLTVNKQTVEEPVTRIVKVGKRENIVIGNSDIWGWPTRSPYTLTDLWGPRAGGWHNGIDISGTGGRGSPIYAVNDGTVVFAGYSSALGYHIEINHNNGYSTLYAHLSKMYVSVGASVKMGQLIGGMGDSGYSYGTHLHFCVKYNGSYIDPFRIYK